jgi:hypothetical protein
MARRRPKPRKGTFDEEAAALQKLLGRQPDPTARAGR